jgi:phosphoglycolate phosphatase-like HAD superfamily hydrolase
MGLIFDLDQTLVDSSLATDYRKGRNWKMVYNLVPQFKIYNGIYDVLEYININRIPYCIITSSPSIYTKKVLDFFEIKCDNLVCYHDTQYHKPHPEPFLFAKKTFFPNTNNILSFGDRLIDIECSNATKIKAIGCLWGSNEKHLFNNTNCYKILSQPIEIIDVIKENFNL